MLRGKVAIVTGGSRGIGFTIASELLKMGAKVVICSRTEKELKSAVKKLSIKGETFGIIADVSKFSDCKKLVKFTLSQNGRVDVLINNAGILGPIGLLETNNQNDWKKVLLINMLGTVYCSKLVIPYMKKQGSGKIINLAGAGVGNMKTLPRFSAYYTSKAAIVAFTEYLAVELFDSNIQVNAIAPGGVASKLRLGLLKMDRGQVGDELYQDTKELKRTGGTPPELSGKLIAFLASEDSNHISGRLLSAKWEKVEDLKKLKPDQNIYRLRRIDNDLFAEKN